ncbi:MAG: hypothetical protein E7262_07110 [Lachnospiraceae bacterium]|nr:hypothetical protein [Lachnospiraceae bacterium]
MKKSRKQKIKVAKVAIIVALICCICCICLVFIYHIVVRTSKTLEWQDFSTYMIGLDAKERVNKFLDGDIDSFVNDICNESLTYDKHIKNYKEYVLDLQKELEQLYTKELKGKDREVSVDFIECITAEDTGNFQKYTDVCVKVVIDEKNTFKIAYQYQNFTTCKVIDLCYEDELGRVVDVVNKPKNYQKLEELFCLLYNSSYSQHTLMKNIAERYVANLDEDFETRKHVIESVLVGEDGDTKEICNRLNKMFKKKIKIDSCLTTNVTYNVEKKVLEAKLVLILSDKNDDKVTLIQDIEMFTPYKYKDDNRVVLSTYKCKDKDAELIGEGLDGISNNSLKKLLSDS